MTREYATARARTWRVREESGPRANECPKASARCARFAIGRLFATPGSLSLLAELRDAGKPFSVQQAAQADDPMSLVLPYVRRHVSGDWGDVGRDDWAANDEALKVGARLFSAYQLTAEARLWVITEADRSSTTVLLPDEY